MILLLCTILISAEWVLYISLVIVRVRRVSWDGSYQGGDDSVSPAPSAGSRLLPPFVSQSPSGFVLSPSLSHSSGSSSAAANCPGRTGWPVGQQVVSIIALVGQVGL